MPMGLAEQQLLQAPPLIQGRNEAFCSIANSSYSKPRFWYAPNSRLVRLVFCDSSTKSGLLKKKTTVVDVGPSIVRIPQLRNRSNHLGKQQANRQRGEHIPCLEAGVAETHGRETTSAGPALGVEGFPSDSGDITSPVVIYPEAGIEVVRSIEEAENEVLKAVIGVDHESLLSGSSSSEIEEKSSSEEGVLPISSSVSELLKNLEPSEELVTDDDLVLKSLKQEREPILSAGSKSVWTEKTTAAIGIDHESLLSGSSSSEIEEKSSSEEVLPISYSVSHLLKTLERSEELVRDDDVVVKSLEKEPEPTPAAASKIVWTVKTKAVIGIDHDSLLSGSSSPEIGEKSSSEGGVLPISPPVLQLLRTLEPSDDDVVVLKSLKNEEEPIPAATSKLVWTEKDIQAQAIGATENKNMLEQFHAILVFAGPALGMWLSGPIMSLIDTSVVGNGSSLELAALGPGTVLCDQLCYVFMFLSVATSNLIATSLAHKDEAGAAHHLSRLLFVSLACGMAMFLITELGATTLLQAFVGVNNAALVPAARTYVQIRAWAWPAVLVGMVAQSASLGMQDSWGPLKVLAIASLVNLCGDIFLCTFLGYGIAGAAWATAASQYVASFLMMRSLNAKGYNSLAIMLPSWNELVHMVNLAAPVLLTMLSKVMFYTCLTYLATSLGAVTLAAHQVMIGVYSLCTVTGEPLAQTAQSFMPALIHGSNRNFKQARSLLCSLMLIGAVVGLTLGCMAISVPWFFPQLFTKDPAIIHQMRTVTLPFLVSLVITPPTLSLEGTLLAGRDLKFMGLSMASCFCGGSLFLLAFNRIGLGLQASWWTLAGFQWARFLQSYMRLASPQSILRDPVDESALKMA